MRMAGGNDNVKGALVMVLSMALFTLNDTFMKTLADEVSLYQILTLRNGAVTVVLLVLAWRMGGLRKGLTRRDAGLAVIRGLAEVATAYFFLTALFNMPLANVTAVLQSAPLMVMLAAAIFLGEPIGWRRVTAVVAGFCGVLLIVRPGTEGFNVYSLYTLVAVLCLTVRDIVTRKLSPEAPTMLVTAITSGLVCLFFGAFSTGVDWVALTPRSGGMIAGAALMVLGAYLSSVTAMRLGEVSFVSPFRYTAMLWALALGFVVFGEWPTGLTLIGAAVVVGSGLYSLWRETVRVRRDRDAQEKVARQRSYRPGA
ncbi:membrane protein, putative [Pseudooceanicola batsensis HTCC2597]|uniref:Membrane protein, putative n=1 Tax=Pseudooceanicola batsensis (strain ATCC BAA-863 / DSM 15984 / KCTC 12145 / HTCC2597) TaxID=252305 RepID=A3TU74_PSEBH|nr:DMT family transporter [Pseudooceanicola batsensis]EAQ04070.1 membrane protein, putative [Pseudooceanicola batsensis HTCC2597]